MVAGHLKAKMRTRRKMMMWVLTKTRGMSVSTTPVIKNLEIREEEEEEMDKVQEEEASMVPIYIAMKKVIMNLNAINDREEQIGEMRVKLGFLMWMRMRTHHIQRMQKEERF